MRDIEDTMHLNKKKRKMAKKKKDKYEGWTELEKKYENNEELRKTGSVLDEESGMLIVIPKLIQFF